MYGKNIIDILIGVNSIESMNLATGELEIIGYFIEKIEEIFKG